MAPDPVVEKRNADTALKLLSPRPGPFRLTFQVNHDDSMDNIIAGTSFKDN